MNKLEAIKEKIQMLIANVVAFAAKPVAKATRFVAQTASKIKALILES